jgi:hypothetical protein
MVNVQRIVQEPFYLCYLQGTAVVYETPSRRTQVNLILMGTA